VKEQVAEEDHTVTTFRMFILLPPLGRGPPYISRYCDSLWAAPSGDRIPVGWEIFCTCPDRPCSPPSLLCNGYRFSFPGVKRPELGIGHPPESSSEVKERVELYLYPHLGLHGLFLGEIDLDLDLYRIRVVSTMGFAVHVARMGNIVNV
jgi:hypothetical protein